MASNVGGLTGVDAATLTLMVRDLLGDPAAVVARGWSCRPLSGGASEGMGLYWVTGSARVGRTTRPWALVCKVCAPADGIDPGAWDYPTREPLTYGSGLLSALPGELTAPRCLAVETQPDGTPRLWLEAVPDVHPGPWTLDRYALAAQHLGRFNGAYLVGTPLPDQPWLSRGWLRDFVEPSGPAFAELERLAGPGGPLLLRRLYPSPVVAELGRLWRERERFLEALDRLPQTFCHHDAFRRNLLHRAGPAGEDLVAIDWAYAGPGAVGEDLGQLVMASLYFFETAGIEPDDLATICFAGYVAGLREAGWGGDEHLARLGFAIDAALRTSIGLLRVIVPLVAEPEHRPVAEDRFGRPLEDVVAAWAELWPLQFGLAEEVRALLPAIK
jgi:hypothetical protein